MTLTDYRRAADRLSAELAHAERSTVEERAQLKECRQSLADAKEAQAALQAVAEGVQSLCHQQIAAVVTRALRTVGFDYDFQIEFRRARGRTEARLWFVREGQRIVPKDAAAGGAIDVAALALRVACILMATPRRRRLIVTDEPMKFVNGEKFQQRVGQLIESLTKDLGFQFILTTDDDWLRIGKVVEL